MTDAPSSEFAGGLLVGKVAVISGVGPGLGEELALRFARHGAAVALAARSEERLHAVAERVQAAGGRAIAVPTDIRDASACDRLADRTAEAFGRVDCIVNNAYAAAGFGPFDTADFADWRELMEVNVFGSLTATRQMVQRMGPDGGSVVFLNAMNVRRHPPNMAGYSMSKAALLEAAQTLARELGPRSIRVNSVLPSWIWGPAAVARFDRVEQSGGPTVQEQYDTIASRNALGVIATEADVANACVYLASDLASAITGQALEVHAGEAGG